MKWDVPGTYTWIAPASQIWVDICGGGGGGSYESFTISGTRVGNGGGAGAAYQNYPLTVVKGQPYTITVGSGGTTGKNGTASSFASLLIAPGGYTNRSPGGPGGMPGTSFIYITETNNTQLYRADGVGGNGLFGLGGNNNLAAPAIGYGAGGSANYPGANGMVSITW